VQTNAQATMTNMLNIHEYNYESLAHQFHQLSERVFYNAKLCNLNLAPEIKTDIYNALNVVKSPCNDAIFLFNTTLINRVLNDIQNKVYAIIDGKPALPEERLSEAFTRAVKDFLARQIK
jgi:hypothetical protein